MVYNKRILLVEDNSPDLNQISLILEKNGYEVLRPETEKKALKMMQRIHIDMVLLGHVCHIRKYIPHIIRGDNILEECGDRYRNNIHARIIEQVEKMIKKDCKLTLKEIEKKLNRDPKYISKLFSKKGKEKFSSYKAKEKLKKAKECLLRNYSIEITTDMVGFEKRQSLYDLFKEYEGCSPIKWLKKQLKKETEVGEYSQEGNKTC